MTDHDILRSIFNVCDVHAQRIHEAMDAMKALVPMTGDQFKNLDKAARDNIEVFTNRFCKLQDTIGAKLIGAVLDWAQEPGPLEAMRDKLNRLEKLGLIDSVHSWGELRDMRNHLAHEYPQNPDLGASYVNQAYAMARSCWHFLHA